MKKRLIIGILFAFLIAPTMLRSQVIPLHTETISNFLNTSTHTYKFSVFILPLEFKLKQEMTDFYVNIDVQDYGAYFPGVFYNKLNSRLMKGGAYSFHWSHNYIIGQQIALTAGPYSFGFTVRAVNKYMCGIEDMTNF